VVIWVHGGAWAIGDKGNAMADKVALWNGAGYAVVSVNYRLSPDTADLDPARVRHPIHAQDVAAAIAWVHEHIADARRRPGRIALLGHSAGAHLVALLGTDPQYLAAHQRGLSSLRCVGSFDTEAYDIPRTMQTASADAGADPAQRVRRRSGGVGGGVAGHPRRAGAGIPPFLLVRRGGADRQATEQAFHDRAARGRRREHVDRRRRR
jgi:acetyl esterase/lipase